MNLASEDQIMMFVAIQLSYRMDLESWKTIPMEDEPDIFMGDRWKSRTEIEQHANKEVRRKTGIGGTDAS
jgi:phage-related protein